MRIKRGRGFVIYLDNHSVTRPCSSSVERMQPYLTDQWMASSIFNQELEMKSRYQALYDLVGADEEDTCVFTSSGAEAVNQALWSVFLEKAKKEGKCHFVTSPLEDASSQQMMQRLEEFGCFVKVAPLQASGQIDVEKLSSLINPRTALVSVTLVDGLTGVLQPIAEIAAVCKEKNVLLHVDASYAVGKLYLSFMDLGVDYLTFSGDRMHALKSSGALFVKAGVPLSPLILGGSFDMASFTALAAAAAQTQLFTDRMGLETARLRDLLEFELIKRIPNACSLFANELRLPNVALLSFPGAHAEALFYLLQRRKLFASSGDSLQQILLSAGFTSEIAETALSFSLSRYTTEEEIYQAISLIVDVALHLQSISAGVL